MNPVISWGSLAEDFTGIPLLNRFFTLNVNRHANRYFTGIHVLISKVYQLKAHRSLLPIIPTHSYGL